MKVFKLALLVFALAACSASVGTSGMTSKGSPVVAELNANGLERITFVTLTSPGKWQCGGKYDHDPSYGRTTSTVTVPLECTDGITGTGIFAIGPHMSKLSMAFTLSTGEGGNVTF